MALNEVYDLYDVARTAVNFQVGGVDTDPTALTLIYTNASGTSTLTYGVDVLIVKDSTGDFHADIPLTVAGLWSGYWRGTGTAAGLDPFEWFVKPSRADAITNNAAGLAWRLLVGLNDETCEVWGASEATDLITWAVASLYPRLARELPYSSTTITLVANTYVYSAPSGVYDISQIDWVDTQSQEMGALPPGSWEQVGDPYAGVLKVHVSPTIVAAGGTLRILGYGRYDASSNLVPDDYVPIVLAKARAEAYRRTAGDRAKYAQWAARNQIQDVSVNELMQLVNEADAELSRLDRRYRTQRRPVHGRRG
jgi:hypothetical protein